MAETKSRARENLHRAADTKADRRATTSLHPPPSAVPPIPNDGKSSPGSNTNPSRVTIAEGDGVRVSAQASADAFIALVNQGIDCWYQAGRMLVAWRKMVPNCFQLITASNPWLSTATLEMFDRIGRKQIHPKVLLLPPMLAHRASFLSYAEQEELINKPMATVRKELKESKPYRGHAVHERGLADKLPTVGHFRLTFVNGNVMAQKAEANRWGVPIVLDGENSCVVQLLKP